MAVKSPPKRGIYVLQLYIAHNTPRSILALANLRALCEKYLAGRYSLEVIDLLKNPQLAGADRIFAVPTLVRELPKPIRKFIGTLSDPESLLVDFDLLQPTTDASVTRR